jgi:dipeptidyl aminopeptidase/acylaminoacyl peptidase
MLVVLTLAVAIAAVLLIGEPRALHIVDVRPGAGATNVSLATQVVVTFSRPLAASAPPGAIVLSPPVDGFVSVAGRRAAFTPRDRLQADTAYTMTVQGVRDRTGRTLSEAAASTFRTRSLALLARIRERGLVRMSLAGERTEVVAGAVGDFTAAPSGAIAWVDAARHVLAIQRVRPPRVDVPLPDGVAVHALEWTPGETALLFLGSRAGGSGDPFVVRLEAAPTIRRLGGTDAAAELPAPLVTERLKRSLIEVVYGADSYAVTRGGAIVRDRTWDFVVVDLDGRRRATVGPFLAVGDASPRGDGILVVDVDPADPVLRRSVAVYDRQSRLRALSPRGMDTHSPRFAHAGDRVVVATSAAADLPRRRRFGLAVIDLATSNHRIVTVPPPGMTDADPRWSPDDSWLMFRRTSVDDTTPPRMWIVPTAGGEARPLPTDVDAARWIP